MDFKGLVKQRSELSLKLQGALLALGVWIKSPIGNNSQAAAVQDKVVGGRERLDPMIVGVGSAADPAQAKAQVGLVHIEFFGKARTLFERLDL